GRQGVVGRGGAGQAKIEIVPRLQVQPGGAEEVRGMRAQPEQLAGGELRVRDEAGDPVEALPAERRDEGVGLRRGAPVHPDDAGAEGPPRPVHRHHAPAVAAQSNGRHAAPQIRRELPPASRNRVPPGLGGLLGPPRLGVERWILGGGLRRHLRGGREQRRLARRGPEIEGENVRRGRQRRSAASGFTTLGGTRPLTPARQFSAAMVAILMRVAVLALPRWGGMTALSSLRRASSIGTGSTSKTSNPAAQILRSTSARYSAR